MTYIEQQLANINTQGSIRVKFTGIDGDTNYLSINKTTFEKLAAVLTEPVLKTYENPNFKRDLKCTYIAALQTTGVLPEGFEHFIEVATDVVDRYTSLYRVGDVQYFGYL
jgi:hypothetical protein